MNDHCQSLSVAALMLIYRIAVRSGCAVTFCLAFNVYAAISHITQALFNVLWRFCGVSLIQLFRPLEQHRAFMKNFLAEIIDLEKISLQMMLIFCFVCNFQAYLHKLWIEILCNANPWLFIKTEIKSAANKNFREDFTLLSDVLHGAIKILQN
jgi:hypothetical protein